MLTAVPYFFKQKSIHATSREPSHRLPEEYGPEGELVGVLTLAVLPGVTGKDVFSGKEGELVQVPVGLGNQRFLAFLCYAAGCEVINTINPAVSSIKAFQLGQILVVGAVVDHQLDCIGNLVGNAGQEAPVGPGIAVEVS